MDAMELIAFEIISNVGMAKSLAIEALRDVRMGNYEDGSKKNRRIIRISYKRTSCSYRVNTKRSSRRKIRFFINNHACRRSNDVS